MEATKEEHAIVSRIAEESEILHNLVPGTIMGPGRSDRAVKARWLVMATLDARGWSQSQIGRVLGKHHTTVLNALRQWKKSKDNNFAVLARFNALSMRDTSRRGA